MTFFFFFTFFYLDRSVKLALRYDYCLNCWFVGMTEMGLLHTKTKHKNYNRQEQFWWFDKKFRLQQIIGEKM